MNVLYVGNYPKNPRSENIIKGLIKQGIPTNECRFPLTRIDKIVTNDKRFREADVFIIGPTANLDVLTLKIINGLAHNNKKIIFDPLVSLYDTNVLDRNWGSIGSMKSMIWRLLDIIGCKYSDSIILDTKSHIQFFNSELGIDIDKMYKIPVGADEEIFYPRQNVFDGKFRIIFYGTYIPLHGVDTIIRASKLLNKYPDIIFELVGTGQTYNYCYELYKTIDGGNINFTDWLEIDKLVDLISISSVGLGIFGQTGKATRVVPNKVYQMMAMKIPIITMNSKASVEVLTNEVNSLLINPGDPKELAYAIERLFLDRNLRSKIASAAYDEYEKKYTTSEIGKKMIHLL